MDSRQLALLDFENICNVIRVGSSLATELKKKC